MQRITRLFLALVVALSAGGMLAPVDAVASTRNVESPAATAANDQTAITDTLVVGYEPGSRQAVEDAVQDTGADVTERLDAIDVVIVETPESTDTSEAASQLAKQPGVVYVEPEVVARVAGVPSDPYYPMQWGLSRVGVPAAHDLTVGSAAVKVAVIDTGLDMAHPDRPKNIDTANSKDFVDDDSNPQDGYGHGTHVAGVIASATGNDRGVASVAPGVKLMVIKALGDTGFGYGSDIALGIRWAADRGAHVINLSLALEGDSTPVREACAYAVAKGCTLVAASGNDGSGVVAYPAAYPGVIAAGAVDKARVRASFSQYGTQLDLVAPGGSGDDDAVASDQILSLWPGGRYRWVGGTSAAAPHVAGAVALVRSVVPTWTAQMVEQTVLDTADDLGAAGRDTRYGDGLVRADKAVAAAANASDNDVPGIPARDRRLTGTLQATSDPHDVYALRMTKGDQLRLTIASAPAGVQVRVLAPEAGTVGSASLATATSRSRSLTYTAVRSGTHYVDVFAASGSGSYVVDYLSGVVTAVSINAPSSSAWGGSAKVSGVLRTVSGRLVGGRTVTVEARPYGSATWKKAGSGATTAAGSFSVKVYPKKRTRYRVVFGGVPKAYQPVTSAIKTIQPYAYLTKPSGPSKIRKGLSFVAAGKLRPWYKKGAKTVSIKVYRRVRTNGEYVYRHYKTYKVKNTSYTTKTTKYSKRLRLPYRGRWKIVAQVKGNTTFRTTTSSARYVTVY